jgi:hypothetical protein
MPGVPVPVYIWYVSFQHSNVFLVPCSCSRASDAVPKKRGPKTDVLEALLKRVDGLEARLKDKKTDPDAEGSESAVVDTPDASTSTQPASNMASGIKPDVGQESQDVVMYSPIQPR